MEVDKFKIIKVSREKMLDLRERIRRSNDESESKIDYIKTKIEQQLNSNQGEIKH